MTTPYTTYPPSPTPQAPLPLPSRPSPEPHPLPTAQTFDFLPPLHALLTRLLIPAPTSSIPQDTNGATGSDNASVKGDALSNPDEYLDIQHLAAASAGIKVRIQKARLAIRQLPGVERSVEELDGEIGELLGRIGKMRAVLGDVGRG